MPCLTCQSLAGEIRLSPGPVIYKGKFWQVEHVYPARLKGWLVLILKRHVEALHELTTEEFDEFAELQARVTRLLHEVLQSEKEYLMCFAEREGFRHVHVHLVAKPHNLPADAKGPKVFSLPQAAVPPEDIRELCEKLKSRLER